MERKRRISAPFLRTGLNNYRQSKTAAQPENTIIALIQAEIADNIFSPIILWTANAGRDYCSAIVVCEFCIAAVQDGCFLASNFPHFHRYDSLKSALYIHAVSKNINTFPKNQGRIRAAIAVKILDFTVMYR